MLKNLLGWLIALAVIPCSAAPVASGAYGEFLIGVDQRGSLTGYFESYTGNGQFSCIFFVSGKLNGSVTRVDTWYPEDRDPKEVIRGAIEGFSQKGVPTVRLKLEDEHGGCWNVQRFASEAASFTLTEKGTWEAIRVVASKKAYFYDDPSNPKPRKAYLVTGNPIRVFETREGWVRAEYVSREGRGTRGWIREKDLFSSSSPAINAGVTSAAPCVKVRDGEKFSCMKFTPDETRSAAKYGLKLGSPFKVARQTLLQQGWVLDREWLTEHSSQPLDKEEMFCGKGWDALCSTAFKRNKATLVLTLSGTNETNPIIDVRED